MKIINIAQAGPMAEATPIATIAQNIANFVTTLIGGTAVIVIVIAGIMYITSGGDSQRVITAKKALMAGVVGLAVAIVALVIINTISNLV